MTVGHELIRYEINFAANAFPRPHPKIMEKQVGVSPVTVMVALLIGGSLLGLVGAILAIPTAAILSVAVDEFATRPRSPAQMARAE